MHDSILFTALWNLLCTAFCAEEIIVVQIVYYTIAFCMTLAGIGGYTTQHLVYCIVRITLYLFPENIPGVWRHALPYIIVA